ncbi:MAG: L-rhamnose mutarotase [Balneolaceae bacterium]|nr:L-rhamnose mutarotase [Balneolaceae bacterium]
MNIIINNYPETRYAILLILLFAVISCSESGESNHDQDTDRNGNDNVKRVGMVIGLKDDKVEEYKKLHANAWPGVLDQLTESNIQNYSIFLHRIEGKHYLFSYFEYVGDNYQKDMEKMAADSVTQEWWKITETCQVPLDTRQEGEWWATMEEVFHHE